VSNARTERIDRALGGAGELITALADAGPLTKEQIQLIVQAAVRAAAPDFKWEEVEAAAKRIVGDGENDGHQLR
jgi:hypothetical protein